MRARADNAKAVRPDDPDAGQARGLSGATFQLSTERSRFFEAGRDDQRRRDSMTSALLDNVWNCGRGRYDDGEVHWRELGHAWVTRNPGHRFALGVDWIDLACESRRQQVVITALPTEWGRSVAPMTATDEGANIASNAEI